MGLFCLLIPATLRDEDLRRSRAGLIMGLLFGPVVGIMLTHSASSFVGFTIFMGAFTLVGRFINGYGTYTMMLTLVAQDAGRGQMSKFQPTASFMAGWLVPL